MYKLFAFLCLLHCIFADRSETDRANELLDKLTREFGYSLEHHYVTTEDGYILKLHRVRPLKDNGTKKSDNSPAVLMMHGLLLSSADWILSGTNRSLAFLLVDNGYDVWLGNNRGCTFSKNHTTLSPDDKAFWNFSFHEFGVYDAPAMIDHVLNVTKQEQLFYIGYSQGTTEFWVLTSLKPEYNKKVKYMTALAPVAYLGHIKGAIKISSYAAVATQRFFDNMGYFEVLSSSRPMRRITNYACQPNSKLETLCEVTMFVIGGFDPQEFDHERMARYVKYFPAGCSYKQLLHYAQLIFYKGQFRPYDYGYIRNMEIYKKPMPSAYPLKNVTTPVGLYMGLNDYLAPPKDVELLRKELPNVTHLYVVPLEKMAHFDFIYGKHARSYVYDHVIKYMNSLL